MVKTNTDSNNIERCSWCTATAEYIDYHDQEWGFPVTNDNALFEKITLESFQSGLSWRTILAKREGFRKAFVNFDINALANFNEHNIDKLLQNESIVRHRGKIEATINNAKHAKLLISEFGSLSAYFWRFEPKQLPSSDDVPSKTAESISLSKDLKKRGWKFVGPTTVYAFMQALGMVNDHAKTCHSYSKVEQAREVFKRPTSE